MRWPLLQSAANGAVVTGLLFGAMTRLYYRVRTTPEGAALTLSFTLAGHRFHPEAP
jgi:hypothetical protein